MGGRYRKRRDRKGRLLQGVHWQPECRWWPEYPADFAAYEEKPNGDMCNHCAAITRRKDRDE